MIAANTLGPQVPADLSALCFRRRAPLGRAVRLYAVGDVGLSGRVGQTGNREGFASLFGEIAPLLRTGTIVFGNLETPLVDGVPPGSLFRGWCAGAAALGAAGFTLVNLANNHAYDYGPHGLKSTLAALQASNVLPLGAGSSRASTHGLVRTDLAGLRIGWLAAGRSLKPQAEDGPYFWEFDEEEMVAAIRQARGSVDVLIVSLHIGNMFVDYPDPMHRALTDRLVAQGADLVLCHHPHVLQGVRVTEQGRVVCHSLGNLVFDWQEGNVKAEVAIQEQNEGAVFVFDLDQSGICLAAVLPTWIDEDCRARWAVGIRGMRILERLARISEELEGDYAAAFRRQLAERCAGHEMKVIWFQLGQGNWSWLWKRLRRVRWEHVKAALMWAFGAFRTGKAVS